MAFKFTKIADAYMAGKGNIGRSDTPGVSTAEMQRIMDELAREVLRPAYDRLCDEVANQLSATTAAAGIGADVPAGLPAATEKTANAVMQAVYTALTDHIADKINPHKVTASQVNAYDKTETESAIDAKMRAIGAGDMAKSVYDTDNDGIVDNAEKLGGKLPEYYAAASDVLQADAGIRGLTATVEASATASQAYAIGAYFVYNGLLCKCTAAIAQGGTIAPGTNCTATTAGAEISTLNQNLAGATGTFAAANSQITVDTGVDWHKLTLIQTTLSGAVGRLAILTPDFGWTNIAGTGYYEPTYAAAKSGNSAIIPAVVFVAWLGTTGTVRWLAE